MPAVGDSSRQARRGLRCAFGPVPAAAVCSLVPAAANPSPTLEWGTGPRPEKRQNSLSSSPLSPIRRTLLPAHALTPVTLETPNTQLVPSISGTPASLPSFREERSALIYGILCPQCFRGTPKPMLILKLQFAFQQLCRLPVHWRVLCNVVNIFCLHCGAAQNVHNVRFPDSRCLTMQPVTYMHTFIFTSLLAAYTMSSLSFFLSLSSSFIFTSLFAAYTMSSLSLSA